MAQGATSSFALMLLSKQKSHEEEVVGKSWIFGRTDGKLCPYSALLHLVLASTLQRSQHIDKLLSFFDSPRKGLRILKWQAGFSMSGNPETSLYWHNPSGNTRVPGS